MTAIKAAEQRASVRGFTVKLINSAQKNDENVLRRRIVWYLGVIGMAKILLQSVASYDNATGERIHINHLSF